MNFKLLRYKPKSEQSSLNKSKSYCRTLKEGHDWLSQKKKKKNLEYHNI